jgi:hypothetical protein
VWHLWAHIGSDGRANVSTFGCADNVKSVAIADVAPELHADESPDLGADELADGSSVARADDAADVDALAAADAAAELLADVGPDDDVLPEQCTDRTLQRLHGDWV